MSKRWKDLGVFLSKDTLGISVSFIVFRIAWYGLHPADTHFPFQHRMEARRFGGIWCGSSI